MDKSIDKQLEILFENNISLDYSIFAYFVAKAESFDEVIRLKKKFQTNGMAVTEEIFILLFTLSENYRDAKK